jgi:hypothetical protein
MITSTIRIYNYFPPYAIVITTQPTFTGLYKFMVNFLKNKTSFLKYLNTDTSTIRKHLSRKQQYDQGRLDLTS